MKIRCTKIHKSDLAQELKLKRSSRAEFAWTMTDWRAAVFTTINSCNWCGCGHPKLVSAMNEFARMELFGGSIQCRRVHATYEELREKVMIRRSSQAKWTVADWRATMHTLQKDISCQLSVVPQSRIALLRNLKAIDFGMSGCGMARDVLASCSMTPCMSTLFSHSRVTFH